ncbi:MAG TPA: L-rhamnose mutarotase [Balneolales bacterium]|nr:L-rhamnose mutarotase [Balneolales bacterium]
MNTSRSLTFKRYCKTLTLRDDPELIKEYKAVHANGGLWPEITQGMKEVGIIDMEIYLFGNQAFMIMDTMADFDHDRAMSVLATRPRQKEWESFVSRFQNTSADATAKDKWQLMERIFKMDQKQEYVPEDGQVEQLHDI